MMPLLVDLGLAIASKSDVFTRINMRKIVYYLNNTLINTAYSLNIDHEGSYKSSIG